MYTQDQLYEFYKEFMKPRIQKNIQEIRAIQEEKGLQLKDALLSRADRLFHKCIRQQQEGKKQPIRYIYFSWLNLSLLTGCYDIQINAFNEQSYMDKTESMELWNPAFIMEVFEKEMKELESEGKKQVFRFGYPQMMELKKRTYPIYTMLAGQFILNHVEDIAGLESFMEMEKAEGLQMVFGGYMDTGMQIWPKVQPEEENIQEERK